MILYGVTQPWHDPSDSPSVFTTMNHTLALPVTAHQAVLLLALD